VHYSKFHIYPLLPIRLHIQRRISMSKIHNAFKTTRLSIWLLLCALILAATSVYAAGDGRPLAAVDILGSPDAAVNGQFAVGTSTPGNKALTVAGVIDFVGAGTVHNYFTQGPGNNMQIRSNVDEVNSVGDASRSQWNMVMGSNLDVFSIRRSPAGAVYNEDALFWIEGDTGNVGIAKVDTSNGATIPFSLSARLQVETDSGDAIRGISRDNGYAFGVYGWIVSATGSGVYGTNYATSGSAYGVSGWSASNSGRAVYGRATASTGSTYGIYGQSDSSSGIGVYGRVLSTSGINYAIHGLNSSTSGYGVYGRVMATNGTTYGVAGRSDSSSGYGVYGEATATSGNTYGIYGRSDSSFGRGVYGQTSGTYGYGVVGDATATSGNAYGVVAQSASTSGRGLYAYSSPYSGTTYGVYAVSNSSSGYDFYAAGNGSNYGPFTGAHEVRLSEPFPTEVRSGMVVSATGEVQIRRAVDGGVEISSTLPTVKLSNMVEDDAVFGVLVAEVTLSEDHWYTPVDGERFSTVNALGEGRVWVTEINGEILVGDYITTSEVPGYGQRQDDDILHNYTLAKATETVDWNSVTETVTYNGQEYKIYLLAVVYTSG
jgi:hypothetical protein